MRALVGSIRRKSRAMVWREISPRAPASSTPVGPPPTTTNVSEALLLGAVALALGVLVGEQDAAADLQRVLERLEARSEHLPLVVTEVRMAWRPPRGPGAS